MAGRRRQQKKHRREDIYITSSKFRISRKRDKGIAVFDYEKDSSGYGQANTSIQIRLDIVSCWIDKKKNNAVKVHMVVDGDIQKVSFMNAIISNGSVDTRDGHLTAEKTGQGGLVRFGCPHDREYEGLDEDYQRYYVYDTKALAVEAIIQRINHNVQVGGVDLVDLTLVDDSVLIESGFEKVPDAIGKGSDMWMGNPDSIIQAGSSNQYSYTAQRDNCVSFLELMRASLS